MTTVDGQPNRRWARKALRVTAYLLVCGFLGYQLWRVRDGLGESLRTVGWTTAILATLLGVVGGVPGFFGWRMLSAGVGVRLPFTTGVRIFFLAGLARYLPGGVWPTVAHAVMARPLGASPARMTAAYLASQALGVVSGMAVSLIALPRLVAADPIWWVLLPILVAALIPLAAPGLLGALLGFAARILRRRSQPSDQTSGLLLPDRRILFAVTGLNAVGWVITGLHVSVLAIALGAPVGQAITIGIGGFALSVLAGVVTVVMPSGIGVRELVLGLTLASLVADSGLVTLVALSRVLLTVGDLASTAVVLGMFGLTGRASTKEVAS
jgi:glycosyltransferase 2 family protein